MGVCVAGVIQPPPKTYTYTQHRKIKQTPHTPISPPRREIERHVNRTCKGEYERPCLPLVDAWRDGVLVPWLRGMVVGGEGDGMGGVGGGGKGGRQQQQQQQQQEAVLGEWAMRHGFSVYEAFAALRIGEAFDVVREFPDSRGAVQVDGYVGGCIHI